MAGSVGCVAVLMGVSLIAQAPADLNEGDRLLPAVALIRGMPRIPRAPHVVTGQSPSTTSDIPLKVDARANIFAAGRQAVPELPGGGGVLPPGFAFTAGPGQVLTVLAASGKGACVDADPTLGPEGGSCIGNGSTDVGAYRGLAGLKHARRQMFLTGVFLSDAEPMDPAPMGLDCTSWTGALEVEPGLGQTFYLGDGLAQGGIPQRIKVPAQATRFFVGIVDGANFNAPEPGYYGDNRGEFSLTLRLQEGQALPTTAVVSPPADSMAPPVVRPKLPPPLPAELTSAHKQAFRQFLKRLKGVPGAHVEERPYLLKERLTLVKADWKRLAPTILPTLTREEQEALTTLVALLETTKGLEASRCAVDAYGLLAGKLPVSWERNLRWADRDVLDAWICVEEGRWAFVPNLAATFVEVLKQGDAEHHKLVPLLRENLQRTVEALRARDKAKAKVQCALLRRLLEELEIT